MQFSNSMTADERYAEAKKFKRFDSIIAILTGAVVDTNNEAVKKVNSVLGDVYKVNYDFIAEQVPKLKEITKTESKKEGKDTISPYGKIAIDKAKDKGQVENSVLNQLTSAVLQGATIGLVFNGIKSIFEKNLNAVKTIETTAVTRTENVARNDVAKKAEKSNYRVEKEWVAILDDKTREAHRKADGQKRKLDNTFTVGGEELLFPCDTAGSIGNTIHCRCTTKYIFDEKLNKD